MAGGVLLERPVPEWRGSWRWHPMLLWDLGGLAVVNRVGKLSPREEQGLSSSPL